MGWSYAYEWSRKYRREVKQRTHARLISRALRNNRSPVGRQIQRKRTPRIVRRRVEVQIGKDCAAELLAEAAE